MKVRQRVLQVLTEYEHVSVVGEATQFEACYADHVSFPEFDVIAIYPYDEEDGALHMVDGIQILVSYEDRLMANNNTDRVTLRWEKEN